ncbi:hypothetical protein [Aeromicrobium sp.]|uniref:hypothetical protein n=1 Tax=Aeromicrobium sp. TaxID=1871063 RepID=UPI0030EF8533
MTCAAGASSRESGGSDVGDLHAAVDAVAADGYGLVGGIGEYENSVRMAYVRGPEGITVSRFEQIG